MEAPPTAAHAAARHVRLVTLPPAALRALAEGDTATAGDSVGLSLPDLFATEDMRWFWRLRSDQVAADPAYAAWAPCAAVSQPDGTVVGHAGFHGPPDPTGMVEVGYTVDPAHRRQGYGRAIVAALLRRASEEPSATRVRASISPENAASLATIAGFGFEKVGEQWDDEDGLEVVFEVRV